MGCFQKKMASPAWTLPLAMLAPVIFMWSKNWFMYSFQELSVSFLLLIFVCLLVFVAGKVVHSLLGNKINKKLKYFWRFVLCVLFLGVLLVFLEFPLRELFAPEYFLQGIILVYSVAIFFSYLIVMKRGFLPINFFLLFWLSLSIGTGLYSVASTVLWGVTPPHESEDEHIVLKNRPNIYFFLLESYHDPKTMYEIYGIDTDPLRTWLSSRDFFVYENVYSNSHATLSSMMNIFGMRLNAAKEMGNNDVDPAGRKLIGGGPGNNVYRILKENGYHVAYLTFDTENPFYYFHTKGKYLDETDIDFGVALSLRPLSELSPFLHRGYFERCRKQTEGRAVNNLLPKYQKKLIDNIRMVMEESKDKMPLFIGFKPGAMHTPFDGSYTWRQKNEWVLGGRYQEAVRRGNQEIFEIADFIIEKDPSAIMIFIGDHGSWRLRGIWNDAVKGDIASLDALLKQHDESLDTLASDIYGTLLAIRMPGGGDISNGLPMSHVNLFRHVFAALADSADPDISRAILERRAPSESGSNLLGFKLVKDGIVQYPLRP